MDFIKNQLSGITGLWGIAYSKLPDDPKEWLLCLSTILISIQICHWGYRFYRWLTGK